MPVEMLLRRQKGLRRELRDKSDLLEVRIAILGGSTTAEVVQFLELLLLDAGIRPIFYESEYNRYFEDAVLDASRLVEFRPQIVYVHTSSVNIQEFPPLAASESDLNACVSSEVQRFEAIWNALHQNVECLVIQNNFELPSHRLLGSLDCVSPGGQTRFITSLNAEFASKANSRPELFINDLNSIAAIVGLGSFHDPQRWFSYKLISTPAGSVAVAKSVAALLGSIYGRSRKCLVLDLDNTLWGGVIADDGIDQIKIGQQTAEAEAYTAFQLYCLRLRERGILLAVCSKNTEHVAKQGFKHPDSILKLDHFSAFKANWEVKHENLKAIATELNLGLDSLVFVDDNPAERAIVSTQLPMVAVPDVGNDVSRFAHVLEESRYFEPATLSCEDLSRAGQYYASTHRQRQQSQFASYDEYLDSLAMRAEIAPFKPVYLERITQLINKTNQFNLTTKRYTFAEVESIASDPAYITLYGKLTDRFGDNGLVSVIIGRREGHLLHVDLWLMSCRVLKRGMETAMLDSLVAVCREHGVTEIYGYYSRMARNDMVSGHYSGLGFQHVEGKGNSSSVWKLRLTADYVPRNQHIRPRDSNASNVEGWDSLAHIRKFGGGKEVLHRNDGS